MKVVPEHNRKDIVLPYPLLERQGVHMGDKTRGVGSKRDTCSVHKREQNGWERQCYRQEGGGGGFIFQSSSFKGFISLYFRLKSACFTIASRFMLLTQTSD